MIVRPSRKVPSSNAFRRQVGGAALLLTAFGLGGLATGAHAQIDATNWGSVTTPVFGTSEAAPYAAAELFAGPNKLGSYFAGVLPNGRIVKPAGISIQIGMNPLGAALTPDSRYLITSNDDEREGSGPVNTSLQSAVNRGGYSLSVIDTNSMTVVSQINTSGRFFVGLQVTGGGPYTVWASGGADHSIKLFTVSAAGQISVGTPATIAITPLLPKNQGFVSNYTPVAGFSTASAPTGFSAGGAKLTFPAGSALSPNGKFLYVACNGDNSLAVIDTTTNTVVKQLPVGYFPYSVSVSRDGSKVFVSNWGITAYKFKTPAYDASGNLSSLTSTGNLPDGFYVPITSTAAGTAQTSSITVVTAPGGNGANAAVLGSIYQGRPLDGLFQVGDTHPSATTVVRHGAVEILYFTKSNSDALGLMMVGNNRTLSDLDLSPVNIPIRTGQKLHGAYPNVLAVSPDNTRLYVAEAGLNSVAVVDTSDPIKPKLLGRIPTGWYPTGLAVSSDGRFLYIVNAKGIGEDLNPASGTLASFPGSAAPFFSSGGSTDSNYIFGSAQKVDLTQPVDNTTVLNNNFALHTPADTSIVPLGGSAGSGKIKHVIFILQENKTFDSMLGSQSGHFGVFASTSSFNNKNGTPYADNQFTGVAPNTQLLATTFAAAVGYFSDSEESDAGHQFSASGTATDYTEKTLLVKTGRGLLVNKNFEPEDYPESGYIFNNAARNNVSFKDYGAMIRIVGTDTGTSTPTTLNDPQSGFLGYPQIQGTVNPPAEPAFTSPFANAGDTGDPTAANNPFAPNPQPKTARTQGLGQTYFVALPILKVLGDNNASGEPHLDTNYPGYNFNISDQRRAIEFCNDFDRMLTAGTLPQFLYIYLPNDHTGGVQAPNAATVGSSPFQQVGDGDVALGMVVQHIMNSSIYFRDPASGGDGTGAAIFITYDDAQSTLDHIHPHRTPLILVSPYAKPGFVATRHYNTASIVKTEELLLGLPPNNLGDLFATDLRDMFQPTPNGITAGTLGVTRTCKYTPSPEGKKIWALVRQLDTSAPDRDSHRLGSLARLSGQADQLHRKAAKAHQLQSRSYRQQQDHLYALALTVVHGPAARDTDD